MLSVCLVSTVWVQGEKHQEEESQHCGVCRWCESGLEEKEKSEWPFLLFELYILSHLLIWWIWVISDLKAGGFDPQVL